MSFYIDPKEIIRRVWPQDFGPGRSGYHYEPSLFRSNALGDFRPEVYDTPDSEDLAERMRNYQSIANPDTTNSRSRRPVAITEIPVDHELNHWGETVWLVAVRTGKAGWDIRTEHIIVRPGTNWADINMSELDMVVTFGGGDYGFYAPWAKTARTLDPIPSSEIKCFDYASGGTGLDIAYGSPRFGAWEDGGTGDGGVPPGIYYKAQEPVDLSSLERPDEYYVQTNLDGWKFLGWGNECHLMEPAPRSSDDVITLGGWFGVSILDEQAAWPVRARLHYPQVVGNMQIYDWTAEETGTPDSRIPIVDEVGIDPETGAITHVTLSQTGLGYTGSFEFPSFWSPPNPTDPTGTGAKFRLYVPKWNEATTIEVIDGGEGYTDPVFTFTPSTFDTTTTAWRLQSLTPGKSVPAGPGTVHLTAATPTEGNAGLYTTYSGISDKQLLNHPAFGVKNTGGATCRFVMTRWARRWEALGIIPEGMSINEYLGYHVKARNLGNHPRLNWVTIDGVRSGSIMVMDVRMIASDWAPLPITLGPGDEQPAGLRIFGHNAQGQPNNSYAKVVTYPEVIEPDVEEDEDPDYVYYLGYFFSAGSWLEIGYDPTELPFAIDGPGGIVPPALPPVVE